MCNNFTFVGPSSHLPGGLLTTPMKKYWPSFYKVSDDGRRKLALKWEDYEVGKSVSHGTDGTDEIDGRAVPTCAQVVFNTFLVRLVLKHASQIFVQFCLVHHRTGASL
jgi:hypothetical protein